VSKHHVYHAIHHNFTTKKPHAAHRFSQKPLQKHLFTIARKKMVKNLSRSPGKIHALLDPLRVVDLLHHEIGYIRAGDAAAIAW
jgi:hypothetical protein